MRVFQEAGRYLGLGIANLIHLLEPEIVLIGGGVSNAGALLLDPVRQTVAESLMSSVFADVRILLAQLKNETGILGAAALALDHPGEATGGS
jgi:glucokinase